MSKLTKRITAMLLSGMLIFGSVPGSVFAASTDVDPGQTSETAQEVYEEDTSEAPAGAGETAGIEEISEEPADVGEMAESGDTSEAPSAEEEATVQYYTVTLDANGGYFENEWDDAIGDYARQAEVVEKHIPVDGTVAAFPVYKTEPDDQSIAFAGWSLERDGELLWQAEEEYIPVDNCVLYAVWQASETEGAAAQEETGEQEAVGEGTEQTDPARETEEAVYADEDAEKAGGDSTDAAEAEEETQPELNESSDEEETVREDAAEGIVKSGTCGENATWVLDDNGTLTISGTGVIDDSAYSDWYSKRSSIKKIVIEEGITGIEGASGAFNYLTNVTDVSIPDSVTSIGKLAFSNCRGLREITIPDSVTNIGEYAFTYCESMTSVIIGNGVARIGRNVFEHCENITCITLGIGVKVIEDFAFSPCKKLRDVYYLGSSSEWSNINIGSSNEPLTNANIAFAYENIKLDPEFTCDAGQTITVTATYMSGMNTAVTASVESDAGEALEFGEVSVSEPQEVDSKYESSIAFDVTGKKAGEYTITLNTDQGASASTVITVNPAKGELLLDSEIPCVIDETKTVSATYTSTDDTAITASIQANTGDALGFGNISILGPFKKDSKYESYISFTVTGKKTGEYPVTIKAGQDIFASTMIKVKSAATLTITQPSDKEGYAFSGKLDSKSSFTMTLDKADEEPQSKDFLFTIKRADSLTKIPSEAVTDPKAVVDKISKKSDQKYEIKFTFKPDKTGLYHIKAAYKDSDDDVELMVYNTDLLKKLENDFNANVKKNARRYSKKIKKEVDELDKETVVEKKNYIQAAQKLKNDSSDLLNGYDNQYSGADKDSVELCAFEALARYYENAGIEARVKFDKVNDYAPSMIVNKINSYILGGYAGNLEKNPLDSKAVISGNTCDVKADTNLFKGNGTITIYVQTSIFSERQFHFVVADGKTITSETDSFLNALKDLGADSAEYAKKQWYKDFAKLVGEDLLHDINSDLEMARSTITSDIVSELEKRNIKNIIDNILTLRNYYKKAKEIYDKVKSAVIVFKNSNSSLDDKITSIYEIDNLIVNDVEPGDCAKEIYNALKNAETVWCGYMREYFTTGTVKDLEPENILETVGNGIKSIIKCPVNVTVLDPSGQAVGYVGDDDIWFTDPVYIDEEGEAKIIYTPKEAGYTLDIRGTDIGLVSYTVQELTDGNISSEYLNYFDMPIEEGTLIHVELLNGSILSPDDVSVVCEENSYQPSAADPSAALNVSINNDPAKGTVTGEGSYLTGDMALVTAVPLEGYFFYGWYEGNTLRSIFEEYQFEVRRDIVLTAVYLPFKGGEDDPVISGDPAASGKCGENCTWAFYEGGTLRISGTGDMYDYKSADPDCAPWRSYKIKSVIIGEGITSIGDYAFSLCSNLSDVSISDSVKSIGKDSFSYCSALTKIIIPGGVQSVGDYAFSSCRGLADVTITEGCTSIGTSAFSGCTSLEEITVPGSIETIESSVFSGCSSLKDLTVSEGVKTIKLSAFESCSSLKNVNLPGSLEEIGWSAFGNCTSLTDMIIPEGVRKIGFMAFNGCTGLESVSIPSTLTSLNSMVFIDCTNLKVISAAQDSGSFSSIDGVLYNKGCTKLICYPEGKTGAFCLPGSVTSIETPALAGCVGLTEITVEAGNSSFSAEDGMLLNKKGFTLVCCPAGKEGSCTIPDGVEQIGNYAFYGCRDLTAVIIPEGVKTICMHAFEKCSGLTRLSLPESLTTIGSTAFSSCSNLDCVVIRKGLASIGTSPFTDCSSLSALYFMGSRDDWNTITIADDNGDFPSDKLVFVANANSLSYARVNGLTDSMYTGTAIRPKPLVSQLGIVLEEGKDYSLAWSNNVNAGTATVTVTGLGNYVDSAAAQFTINPASLSGASITGLSGKTYTGKAIVQAPVVKLNEKTLINDTDYALSYSNNTNAGTATVTITGMGNYTGTVSKNFTISAASIANATVTGISNKTYTGSALTQNPAVKVGDRTLTKGTDYTLSFADNTNVGTATVTITGRGNYTSKKTVTFKINKAAQSITAKAAASSIAVGRTTTVSIAGAKGTKSYKSSDTTIAAVTSAGKVTAKKVGTVKITATSAATSNYNSASKTVTIKVVPAATTSLTAANQATGIKLTWKKVTGANGYKLYRGSTLIKTITSGSTVTFADAKANTNGTKYTYKVVAKASTGDSTLSKSVAVYRVARPVISSVTNSASKKMTVKWGKNAKANGYVIHYSLDKAFKSGNKSVTVTSVSTVSRVISSLTKGKTYYVRIRTYKTVGSAKYWSEWSAARSVKISK